MYSANERKGTITHLIRKKKLDIIARDIFRKTVFKISSFMIFSNVLNTLYLIRLDNAQVLNTLKIIKYFKEEAEGLKSLKKKKF